MDAHCLDERPAREESCHSVEACAWTVSDWTACSTACGRGTRTRNATCPSQLSADCGEQPSVAESCYNTGGCSWHLTDWSACNPACGDGIESRTVSCPSGVDADCGEARPEEQRSCTSDVWCEWLVGEWSVCEAACGEGLQVRSVLCSSGTDMDCPRGRPVDQQPCYTSRCEWHASNWDTCSQSCGQGTRTRDVTCSSVSTADCASAERPLESEICHGLDCHWQTGAWTSCSSPLCFGSGTRIRNVSCPSVHGDSLCSSVRPTAVEACESESPCDWRTFEWSVCDNECGVGTATREVLCPGRSDASCHGARPETSQLCEDMAGCGWSSEDWSNCLTTCGPGAQTRATVCEGTCEGSGPRTAQECIDIEQMRQCEWIVGEWTRCSVDCGHGVQLREVACPSGVAEDCWAHERPIDARECHADACAWVTSSWSLCSSTCGEGTQERLVSCASDLPGDCDDESRPASVQDCSSSLGCVWATSSWRACSEFCGEGLQTRDVWCPGTSCAGSQPTESQACSSYDGCGWEIGEWSGCDVTCGEGLQSRSAQCAADSDELCDEAGPVTQQACVERSGCQWTVTDWSSCSSTCGYGRRTRGVSCPATGWCEEDQPVAVESCSDMSRCDWVAGDWSSCAGSCGPRQRPVNCRSPRVADCPESPPPSEMICDELECSNVAGDVEILLAVTFREEPTATEIDDVSTLTAAVLSSSLGGLEVIVTLNAGEGARRLAVGVPLRIDIRDASMAVIGLLSSEGGRAGLVSSMLEELGDAVLGMELSEPAEVNPPTVPPSFTVVELSNTSSVGTPVAISVDSADVSAESESSPPVVAAVLGVLAPLSLCGALALAVWLRQRRLGSRSPVENLLGDSACAGGVISDAEPKLKGLLKHKGQAVILRPEPPPGSAGCIAQTPARARRAFGADADASSPDDASLPSSRRSSESLGLCARPALDEVGGSQVSSRPVSAQSQGRPATADSAGGSRSSRPASADSVGTRPASAGLIDISGLQSRPVTPTPAVLSGQVTPTANVVSRPTTPPAAALTGAMPRGLLEPLPPLRANAFAGASDALGALDVSPRGPLASEVAATLPSGELCYRDPSPPHFAQTSAAPPTLAPELLPSSLTGLRGSAHVESDIGEAQEATPRPPSRPSQPTLVPAPPQAPPGLPGSLEVPGLRAPGASGSAALAVEQPALAPAIRRPASAAASRSAGSAARPLTPPVGRAAAGSDDSELSKAPLPSQPSPTLPAPQLSPMRAAASSSEPPASDPEREGGEDAAIPAWQALRRRRGVEDSAPPPRAGAWGLEDASEPTSSAPAATAPPSSARGAEAEAPAGGKDAMRRARQAAMARRQAGPEALRVPGNLSSDGEPARLQPLQLPGSPALSPQASARSVPGSPAAPAANITGGFAGFSSAGGDPQIEAPSEPGSMAAMRAARAAAFAGRMRQHGAASAAAAAAQRGEEDEAAPPARPTPAWGLAVDEPDASSVGGSTSLSGSLGPASPSPSPSASPAAAAPADAEAPLPSGSGGGGDAVRAARAAAMQGARQRAAAMAAKARGGSG